MHRAWPCLLFAMVCALSWPVTVGDGVWLPRHSEALDQPWASLRTQAESEPRNDACSDKVNLLWPDAEFLHRQAIAQQSSWWNPYVLSGTSTASNPLAAAFSPVTHLLSGLPPLRAMAVSAALHLLIFGLGVSALLRTANVHPVAALFGGAVSMVSGWVAAHLHNVPIVAAVAYWPYGLLGLIYIHGGRRVLGLTALVASIALQLRAGFPQSAVYGFVALLVVGLTVLASRRTGVGRGRFVLLSLAGLLFGLLLAASPLLGAKESMAWSGHHARTGEDLASERFRPGGWIGLVAPYLLGSFDSERNGSKDAFLRTVAGEGPELTAPPVMGWGERTIYVGLVVVLLAMIGILGRPSVLRVAMTAMVAIGILLSSSSLVIQSLDFLPPFAVGAPARAIVLVIFGLVVLAALGLDSLLRGEAARVSRAALIIALVVGSAASVVALTVQIDRMFAADLILRAIEASGLYDRIHGPPPPRPALVTLFLESMPGFLADAWRLAALGFASAGALALHRQGARRLACSLLLVAAVADPLAHFLPAHRPVRAQNLFAGTPALEFLQQRLGHDRFARVSPSEAAARAETPHLLVPNLGVLYGIRDAQGYREQVRQSLLALWKGVAAVVREVGVSGVSADRSKAPLLDLMGVRYLIAKEPIAALESVHLVVPNAIVGDLTVYENVDAQPRAWFVGRARTLPLAEIPSAIDRGEIHFRSELVVPDTETLPLPNEGSASGTVEFIRDQATDVELRVISDRAGYLIISDTWDKGWTARVAAGGESAREVKILPAFGALRAVPVPPGEHLIHFQFRPAFLTTAMIFEGGGLVLLALFLILLRPKGRRSAATVEGAA